MWDVSDKHYRYILYKFKNLPNKPSKIEHPHLLSRKFTEKKSINLKKLSQLDRFYSKLSLFKTTNKIDQFVSSIDF